MVIRLDIKTHLQRPQAFINAVMCTHTNLFEIPSAYQFLKEGGGVHSFMAQLIVFYQLQPLTGKGDDKLDKNPFPSNK